MHDTIILGGGPAGLSAGVYLGRYLRHTLVIDAGKGRAAGHQVNENYLGFPKGIKVQRLRELGRQQAERFGVEFCAATVTGIVNCGSHFSVECGDGTTLDGKALIFATGVSDIWPAFPHVERYIGKSLFWCITCDGHKTQDKAVLLLGNDDHAATTALQFRRFTKDIRLLVHPTLGAITPERRSAVEAAGIAICEGVITHLEGKQGIVKAVCLDDGMTLKPDFLFSLYGAVPNSQMAAGLGVLLNDAGYIIVDTEQRTNVPGIYAAGDVTGSHAHQIACAVHEGAMAACAANYDLYPPLQRHDADQT